MASVDQLAVKYSSQLAQLQAIFPSWDESDLAYTLQDTKGNVEEAALSITEGRASQFTSASKKKPAKSKETFQKGHSNRNADTGGWENVNGEGFASRGDRPTRGGRGGARGGRGGRGGEPFRGGRGGRGGFRGGRGGLANVNGHSKPTASDEFPTTTATTTEGWANQVQQATSADAEEGDNAAIADTSKGEDFSASGGWGDAPAPKELEKAAKAGGTGWQKDIEKPVQVAGSSVPPAAKPKLTWAQIAKPVEKPKPAPPPPAPVAPEPVPEPEAEPTVTSDEPVAQDEGEVVPEALEETPAEEVEALGDAPAPEEVEEAAAAIEDAPAAEEPFTAKPAEDLLPEETAPAQVESSADAWESDPAIAGSGAQPEWAKAETQPAAAPEPVTTYQGPPGFNSVVAKAAPGVQAAQQPRSSSRAAQRYKDAEGQGVVLPPTASGIAGMEMQFGSLSFGGINGDGVDSPVPAAEPPKQETPVQAAPAPAPVAASPVRTTQPSVPAQQAQQPSAPTPAAAPSAPSAPFYSQPSTQPAQTQAQPQTQQASYSSPHQTLQQQMQTYQYLQQQQAPAHSQSQDQGIHPSHQANQYYRQQDFYNPIGSQAQQQSSEPQGQQGQGQQSAQQAQQATSSPYDTPFGAFGQQSHLFGQPAQQQSQHSQANDPYGASQRAYDSYTASGYPRPPVDEPKPAAPAPSHTPSAPSQPPHQQSGYYSQMGNMGYYQQGPYNPYYQYGQAPQAGFQQYYPLAQRNLYGQPAPQAPPAPIQGNKPQPPSSHSPYGGPPSYPSSATYDDQSFGGGLGRYGDSKAQQQQTPGSQAQAQAQGQNTLAPGSYNSQQSGLHNFLGSSTSASSATGTTPSGVAGSAGRPQATTPDDGFKTQTQGRGTTQIQQNQAANPQAAQQGFNSYPYGGNAGGVGGYGAQDWSHYGQAGHYGSRNGYQHWQQ
ncbi:hypothetical protein I302_100908 [Kwoniella bestiolae CBS 10118]|uniref:RNA polymerase II degradation factor 1 n=1 Tax=Kwoniella bestiolae CBS 10118 TaxID=1296100 RepID=A0A1B9G6H5_9TREE|nr:hypothetical protein I302_04284 [Kwoniella bestiolae CBS 10118]OCF26598.1 hypothetical protein I302_04284 [Kwoniella bestiolae CBS 10118]